MVDPSRSRARPRYRGTAGAGSQAPRPGATPWRPAPYPAPGVPANDNARRALQQALRRAGARGLARLFPLLGSALLAYELWQWYFQPGGLEDYELCAQYAPQPSCPGSPGGPRVYRSHPDCVTNAGCFIAPLSATDPAAIGFKPTYIRSGLGNNFGGAYFGNHDRTYMRVGPSGGLPQLVPEVPLPVPTVVPGTPPSPLDPPSVPPAIPWFDPIGNPIGAPQPVPFAPPMPAIPARPVEPIEDPAKNPEAPQRGPSPRPRTRGRRHPGEATEAWPRRGARRSPRPRTPPPGGTKEKKLIGQLPPGFLKRFLSSATEVADFIDCIYKALPKNKQSPRDLPQDKLNKLYQYWEDVNVQQALLNCLQEQVEDYIFGRLGRLQATANRRLGVTTGSGGPGRIARRGLDVRSL